MATAIGVVSGVIGIFTFVQDLIPAPEETSQRFIVQVALDGTSNGEGDSELSNAGGGISNIRIYDNNGVEISDGGTYGIDIGQGEWDEIEVNLNGNFQGTTAEFYASDDAICIATISTTLNDAGGSSYGFTGDWSTICNGVLGYPSGINVPVEDSDEPRQPWCVWIDGNGDAGEASSIGINFPSVANYEGSEAEVTERCGRGPGFRAWSSDNSQLAEPNPDWQQRKRSVKAGHPHPGRRDNRLVISDSRDLGHQASEVCDNASSYGPDFISLNEMTYCNMSSREVLPLCGSEADDGMGCFDLEESRGNGPAKRSAPGRHERALGPRQSKAPTRIIDWTRK